jgi:hypothetical protein
LRDQGQTEKTIRAMIGRNCKIRGVRPGLAQLDSIEHMLSSLITATSKTSKDLASSEGFAEGDQWNLMIPKLRALFRSSGLPHAASQDSAKTKTARGSAFVLFIKALQQSFPDPALRKHHGVSDFTLAKEINRASKKSGH